MDHANSISFQKHYLGREIAADLWGILRGQKPQQALIQQSCSIGHSISQRRPADLTAEQALSVNILPLVQRLTRELQNLPWRSQQYKDAMRVLRKEKQRLKRELKQKIRDEWTAKQAVDDIECQLQGDGFKPVATDSTHLFQEDGYRRSPDQSYISPLVVEPFRCCDEGPLSSSSAAAALSLSRITLIFGHVPVFILQAQMTLLLHDDDMKEVVSDIVDVEQIGGEEAT